MHIPTQASYNNMLQRSYSAFYSSPLFLQLCISIYHFSVLKKTAELCILGLYLEETIYLFITLQVKQVMLSPCRSQDFLPSISCCINTYARVYKLCCTL